MSYRSPGVSPVLLEDDTDDQADSAAPDAHAAPPGEPATEETRHRRLFAALPQPVLVAGADGRITSFNAAALALFGTPARLRQQPVHEVLPFVPRHELALPAELRWQGQLIDAAGRTVELEVHAAVLVEQPDEVDWVYLLHDISRHTELSQRREQHVYAVAHELRGPLMVIENALEMLNSDYATLTEVQSATLLGSAQRTARRLRTLMDDLLSTGSVRSGRFAVTLRPTELRVIVADALDIVSADLDSRGQRVDVRLPPEPVVVQADRRYARQALANLLANASKYSPEQSRISVSAASSGAIVRLDVIDRGRGIPREHHAGLFEPFYRIRWDNDEPGAGLGLAIAKGIVEAHNGTIGLESQPGGGTRVWFTLRAAGTQHADPPG